MILDKQIQRAYNSPETERARQAASRMWPGPSAGPIGGFNHMITNKIHLVTFFALLCFFAGGACGAGPRPVTRVPRRPGDQGDRPGVAGAGVSAALARERAAAVSDVRYRVVVNIPLDRRIDCITEVSFNLRSVTGPLVLDFAGESVGLIDSDRDTVAFDFENEHLIIPERYLREGENHFAIQCKPIEAPLHREKDHLYSLFVPARAREVFPCFDQPDIKARFTLELIVPIGWTAVSNTSININGWRVSESLHKLVFRETEPLSTYHFAFAAGEFRGGVASPDGRAMVFHHIEHDSSKVARNTLEIFLLHAEALRWMEEYTGIEYPFGTFDFVALPAFPYSGMEHPGSIFYRAERLFLEESATEMDRLRRASVISHETAHMWFGDLVTMTWFDDVWLKEAFAQFMADRIIRPAFPGVDHRLLFAASHYDALYEVDRTAGTNPIRQELDNLNEAGSLYGNIIYHKPPVMLNQLEALMGEENLRTGLRQYLRKYRFANADWNDLIAILDPLTERDLGAWSTAWVMERGRPRISVERIRDASGICRTVRIAQDDPLGRGLVWPQAFSLLLTGGASERIIQCELNGASALVRLDEPVMNNEFILPCVVGAGFGYFVLDEESRALLRRRPPDLAEPLHRFMYSLILHDNVLEGDLADIMMYTNLIIAGIEGETVEMNLQALLGYFSETFWCFLSDSTREARAGEVERLLLDKMNASQEASMKSACFKAFRSVAVTDDGVQFLRDVCERKKDIEGLHLSERDYAAVAYELAVRGVPDWRDICDRMEERIEDEELLRRFRFVRRAASADRGERDVFFDDLSDVENRRHEPWVLEALAYLHHPLRARESERYIPRSLELLEEIRATGDIFFPRDWIQTTLRYHHSGAALSTVREFLEARPDYNERLRLIVLQATDLPQRANQIRSGTQR
jgi:aminopeptidase N